MTLTVNPFLMFQGQAEEAMKFYVELIPDSRIIKVEKYGPEGPGAEGSVISAVFTLSDLTVMCSDSPMPQPFTFTPSSSLFITCPSEPEVDRLVAALSDGGAVLMPPDDYGFSREFAWVNDRFGVSWQLNLEQADGV